MIGEPSAADEFLLKQLDIDYSAKSKLTEVEMQEAYATSDFLLFASTLEGFGMPIIEAQMVGLPVITSNIDPMREVAGSGALLCNPLETESIQEALLQLLQKESLQKQLIKAGQENHKRYSPALVAVELAALYSYVLDS